MLRSLLVPYLGIIALGLSAVTLEAKEVTLQYKGLRLNANLELAAGKKLSNGVILITHGGLAHYGMELIVYLQELLRQSGYNTLAINLSLGLSNRHGMYDCRITHRHRHDDAGDEIGAWIDWLHKQGAKYITLLGHSRGGLQTALYAAERDNALLKAIVLLAPATLDNGAPGYRQRYNKPLTPLLEKAHVLIKQGKGTNVIEHANLMFCRDTSVTANTFISYYGADLRLDTPYLLPKLNKPTLILVAGKDEIVVALDRKTAPLTGLAHLQVEIIEDAGHSFRDLNADEAVEIIDAFLRKIEGKPVHRQ